MGDDQIVEETVTKAIEYAKELVGVPYAAWTGTKFGEGIGEGPPFWNGLDSPSKTLVFSKGCNCLGLINLISLAISGESHDNWFALLEQKNVLEPYDPKCSYPKGTLLLREYRDLRDQGHLAMMVSKSHLVHSHKRVDPNGPIDAFLKSIQASDTSLFSPGVIIEPIAKSHSWFEGGTYTHVCRPKYWLL